MASTEFGNIVHKYQIIRQKYPSLPENLYTNQIKCTAALLKKKDVLCVMPTAGGKTLAMILMPLFLEKSEKRKVI